MWTALNSDRTLSAPLRQELVGYTQTPVLK